MKQKELIDLLNQKSVKCSFVKAAKKKGMTKQGIAYFAKKLNVRIDETRVAVVNEKKKK